MIGTEAVAKAAPDGYTLLGGNPGPLTIAASVRKQLNYDGVRDFAPITLIALSASCMCAHPTVPAKGLREFIALAKKSPGRINYATPGIGTVGHFAIERDGLVRERFHVHSHARALNVASISCDQHHVVDQGCGGEETVNGGDRVRDVEAAPTIRDGGVSPRAPHAAKTANRCALNRASSARCVPAALSPSATLTARARPNPCGVACVIG